MSRYHRIYEDMPANVEVPPELRHRRVEIILSPLDEGVENTVARPVYPSTWPADFFAQTAGRWAGKPLTRESEGEHETREEFE